MEGFLSHCNEKITGNVKPDYWPFGEENQLQWWVMPNFNLSKRFS
jgi:hypothetical protein